ncbi:hypothetical protein ElyMa_005987800 [Elysia marginata]|uniref:Uncharacterized protein n=1 Tax=Elysia marginata TaxID=1093978 RepID=A0AAV4GH57_9GAST|nr:hypothetical protein ElyMa_005987800 [Elysia marginata]
MVLVEMPADPPHHHPAMSGQAVSAPSSCLVLSCLVRGSLHIWDNRFSISLDRMTCLSNRHTHTHTHSRTHHVMFYSNQNAIDGEKAERTNPIQQFA